MTVLLYFDSIDPMLKIRLQRTGRKHEPTYRLVLADSKSSAKSGKYLEMLGNYDSRHGEKSAINSERVLHWLSVGAQASITVHNMLIDRKIITGKKINKLPLKSPIKKEVAEEKTATPAEETAVAPEPAEKVVTETEQVTVPVVGEATAEPTEEVA